MNRDHAPGVKRRPDAFVLGIAHECRVVMAYFDALFARVATAGFVPRAFGCARQAS
nr:hypothetical protein [Nocardia jejuensis]